MKNIKRKIIYILIFMFLPLINVKANTVSLKLECPKEAIPGNDIICTLNGVAEEVKITSLSTKITVEGNMEFVSFNNESSWNLTTEDEGIINLTSESSKTGNFKIGTITLKAKNNDDDAKSSISFMNNIFYSDNSSELTILPISKTIRIHSTNNKLHTIFLSTEPLSPAFDKEITTYTATTNNDTITINASPESKYSTIIGTGKKELSYGVNDFEIKVTSEVGETIIYKISITRIDDGSNNINNTGKTNDSKLQKLSIEGYDIDFNKNIYNYNIEVEKEIENIDITAIPENKNSKVNIEGNKNLKIGQNEVTITVISESGSKTNYKIYVTRNADICIISGINIEGYQLNFNCHKYNYELKIKNESSLNITPILKDDSATYTIINNNNLKNEDIITIKTTLNGTTHEYNIKVFKNSSTTLNFFSKLLIIMVSIIVVLIITNIVLRKNLDINLLKMIKKDK